MLYANRAAVHVRKRAWRAAVDDCRRSLQLDPEYTKARNRLATALVELGEYDEAVREYDAVLAAAPDSAAARKGRERAVQKMRE